METGTRGGASTRPGLSDGIGRLTADPLRHLRKAAEKLSPRLRWSSLRLRDKLLTFYAAMITVIILINAATGYVAFNSMQVFDRNLINYFEIHQLQTSIESSRVALERYLREKSPPALERYRMLTPAIRALLQKVSAQSDSSLEAYFQVRAAGRGVDAYFRLGDLAVSKRSTGQPDYYTVYVQAAKIQAYVDAYVSQLLSIQLSEGSRSYQVVLRRAMTVRLLSFLAILLLGVVSLVFAVLFTNYVSRPVRRLADLSSRIAAGDLNVGELPVESQDEIGILAASFNAMSRSIRERVNDLREKAVLEKRLHKEELTIVRMGQSLREAQFLGLQSQINPHFLFNTLNIIARNALFERAETTAELVRSLATLFRYNLRDARKPVTLEEELDILEEYLSIQQRRFEERLELHVGRRDEAERVAVPCFTLQPLVENALKHGIEPKVEGGRLEVSVDLDADTVHIVVRDDGVGMTAEQVHAVLSRSADGSNQSSGIGIPNVVDRLRLLYHGRERFAIDSSPGRGTAVHLSIPYRERARNDVSPVDR